MFIEIFNAVGDRFGEAHLAGDVGAAMAARLYGTSKLQQAKEAVQAVTDTVKVTTQTVADAIEAGRQPGAPSDRLAEWAKGAPLQALAVAFVVGVMVGRRL